jgi:hypothetical protein
MNLPGNANKTEALAKAAVGSAVFAGAATLLGAGRLSWGAPTSEKERDAFYAAGIQPYSVKIGNKWVSYSKLGPLAFPIAMVAAVDDAEKNAKLDESVSEQIIQGLAKYGEFFADQSYLKSIGDLLNSGQKGGIGKVLANYPQQLIPYRAALGWVARLTDDIQRDPNAVKGGLIEQQLAQTFAQIPGLSRTVPARTDAEGTPLKVQNQVFNAFSPLKVTTENPAEKANYDTISETNRQNRRADQEVEALKGRQSIDPQELLDKVKAYDGGNSGSVSSIPDDVDKSIKTLSNGKFAYRDSSGTVTTYPTKDKAAKAVAVDKIRSGDADKLEVGNYTYVKADNEQGYKQYDLSNISGQLSYAKDRVGNGEESRVEVGGKVVVSDDNSDNGYRVVDVTKERESAKQKQEDVDIAQAKADRDYSTWESLQKNRYESLSQKLDTLDPELDAADIVDTKKKIAALLDEVRKYRGYGGSFSKPKKPRAAKRVSASAFGGSAPKIPGIPAVPRAARAPRLAAIPLPKARVSASYLASLR